MGLTKEDYLKLGADRMAELLVERDRENTFNKHNLISYPPYDGNFHPILPGTEIMYSTTCNIN